MSLTNKSKEWLEKQKVLPAIGDKLYIPVSDSMFGGLATILRVHYSDTLPEDHFNYIMVSMVEARGHQYNWKMLIEEQPEHRIRYKGQIAHADNS